MPSCAPSSSRSSQKKSFPASAAVHVLHRRRRVAGRPGAGSRAARATVSPRPAAPGWMMALRAIAEAAGIERARQRRLVRRQRDARHGVRQHPRRVGPLQQAVGAVARGHPGVAPARQPAHHGAVVGRRRAGARPASRGRWRRRARARRSGTRAAARAGPPRSRSTEKPAPASNVPPQATRPPGQGTR